MPRQNPRPSDPDVKLPAAVAANAARVDQFYADKEAAENPDNNAGNKSGNNGEQNGTPPAGGEGAPPPAANAAPPAPEGVTPQGNQSEPENWEQRYKAMKGRYDRAEGHIRDLQDRQAALERTIAALNKPAALGEQPPPQSLITPEERETYGEDFIGVLSKAAKEQLTPLEQRLMGEIDNLKKRLDGVGSTVTRTAREDMHRELDKEFPAWRTINEDDKFLDWLALPDPFSGGIRMNLLQAAYEQNNAPRVLAFFKGFRSEEATVDPASKSQSATRTNGTGDSPPAPKVPLKDLAAPGRARTAAGNDAPADKPLISRRDIAAFYAAVGAGKYKGREKEKDAAERELFEAEREGRIID